MNPRVFITGYGIITSIGNDKTENFQSLSDRRSGLGELSILDTAHQQDLPGCEIRRSHDELHRAAGIRVGQGFTRTALLGLLALREAVAMAKLSPTDLHSCGLISATTTGGIRELEQNFYKITDLDQSGDFVQFTDTANPGEHCERIADVMGIKAHLATVSTACSSSANAIMQGAQLIRHRKLNRVICGGAEALSRFTINGFHSLMIVDPAHCRPFDATRNGLNLGEGAAYLVLESEQVVQQKQITPIAELRGYGNANDAFHQTASSPEGIGALLAMQLALSTAAISPEDVDYINAHGTATENNDLSEGMGIQRLFGKSVPPFSSTKPFTGHTLAAAGSIEAVYCIMALQNQCLWPSLNFENPMPELSIRPLVEFTPAQNLKHVLSNSFGFGGNTSSLLFSQV
jgi:3-oxoacyl-[acyl-carrier-protein] synthase-1